MRLGAPVIGVRRDGDVVVLDPLDEAVRPRADGVLQDAQGAVLAHGRRAHDAGPDHGQAGRERRERPGERDAHRVIVDRGIGLDKAVGEADEAFGARLFEHVVLVVRVEQPVEVLHQRGGVEGGAVLEAHALAQGEGVRLAAVGHGIAGGQAGSDVDRAGLVLQELVEDGRHDEAC